MKNITMVIPTFNSPAVLQDMLISLYMNTDWEGRVIIVNNGEPLPFNEIAGIEGDVSILSPGKNLGWMGGVNLGLEKAESELFCMANDDLLFPPGSWEFWNYMVKAENCLLLNEHCGVAPSSNYVSGCQNAFWHTRSAYIEAPYLIGMLAMYPTQLLKTLGGLDESLPGGDDLDLSIRVKDFGGRLICSRHAYVHHIGSQTGRREQPDYWDTREHQMATTNALIKKHGMKKWAECWMGVPKPL